MALSVGQLVAAVQTLGAFRQMQLTWVEPMKSILELRRVLAFDIQVIRAECMAGEDDPVNNYVMRLLLYPFFAYSLLLALLRRRALVRPIEKDRILNSQGLILLIVYISLVLACLCPGRTTR